MLPLSRSRPLARSLSPFPLLVPVVHSSVAILPGRAGSISLRLFVWVPFVELWGRRRKNNVYAVDAIRRRYSESRQQLADIAPRAQQLSQRLSAMEADRGRADVAEREVNLELQSQVCAGQMMLKIDAPAFQSILRHAILSKFGARLWNRAGSEPSADCVCPKESASLAETAPTAHFE